MKSKATQTTSTQSTVVSRRRGRAGVAIATVGLLFGLSAMSQPGSFAAQALTIAPATAHASAQEAPAEAPVEMTQAAPSAAVVSLEGQLLELLNADRAANGLGALELDLELTSVARWRSEDMAQRNYFSHDIGGFQVFTVLKELGITYRMAGENLAFNYVKPDTSAAAAERALMASPAHRENILREDFTHAGIGVSIAPDGRVLYTQLFKKAR